MQKVGPLKRWKARWVLKTAHLQAGRYTLELLPGSGAPKPVFGTEQGRDGEAGRAQALHVMDATGIDAGMVCHQADAAAGHQVDAIGQEDLDAGPHRRATPAGLVGGTGTAHYQAHNH